MAHLETYWHPRYEEMSAKNLITFKKSVPSIAHQQILLDKAWVVEFFNEEVVVAFEIPQYDSALNEALAKNHFIFVKSRRMLKKLENGEEEVKFCYLYSNHTK